MLTRRQFLGASLAVLAAPSCAPRPADRDDAFAAALASLESSAGGRLGACVLDTGSAAVAGHREHERFALCSTFKMLLAAVVLRDADRGRLTLDRFVAYDDSVMVPYAPVTSRHLDRGGMTVGELAEAAQVTSDNVAANLLLDLVGGPAGFTRALRELGDDVTRLDRYEPEMNIVRPGEERDTTTPAAMARALARVLADDLLAPASRELLIRWTVATKTGRHRLRAGFPGSWRAGDKTGTGIGNGLPNRYNDVAIAWPPGRPAVVVSAYYEAPGSYDRIRDEDQAVLAEVGRITARLVG